LFPVPENYVLPSTQKKEKEREKKTPTMTKKIHGQIQESAGD